MKKIFLSLLSVFTILISFVVPFTAYADDTSPYFSFDVWKESFVSDDSDFYFVIHGHFFDDNNCPYYNTIGVTFKSDFDYNLSTDNNSISLSSIYPLDCLWFFRYSLSPNSDSLFEGYSPTSPSSNPPLCYGFSFDYSTLRFYNSSIEDTFIVDDFETNIDDILPPNPLNLSISFEPDLNGTISRTTVHNGKEYTSTTLDLHVTNYGDDAQFSWFILPHGDTMSFPSSLLYNAQGFNDNPIYVYVSDEWLGFQVSGMQGNSLYCPTSWHSVPHGYTNQIYHVPWTHMKLSPDTSYDVVVYACTNSISHGEKLVSADLSNVQEVYRSTFTISDPAAYNPSGDAYGDHPWDPEEDHSNLFNVSSAFKDDYGNVVIRGQTGSGGGLVLTDSGFVKFSDFSTSSKALSFRQSFNNFIGFVTYVFSRFPHDISNMYYYSFLCVSVLGIIKAVIH